MALYQTMAKAIQDHIHLVATMAALTTAMKVRAFTAAPTAAGGGTEVAAGSSGGTGYTAGGTTMAWNAATTATPSVSTNQAASWTGWPRAETVSHIDVTDSAGTPVKVEFGNLTTAKVMAAGDTLSLSAAAVSSSLQ
jgi:hypothetical protein